MFFITQNLWLFYEEQASRLYNETRLHIKNIYGWLRTLTEAKILGLETFIGRV